MRRAGVGDETLHHKAQPKATRLDVRHEGMGHAPRATDDIVFALLKRGGLWTPQSCLVAEISCRLRNLRACAPPQRDCIFYRITFSLHFLPKPLNTYPPPRPPCVDPTCLRVVEQLMALSACESSRACEGFWSGAF